MQLIILIVAVLSISLGNASVSDDCSGIIIPRKQWGAKTPLEIEYTIIPVKNVIIHHTVTPKCSTESSCSNILKNIQHYHMNNLEFHDIGYNFMIGGDGKVYEGAGWHKVGAHTIGYNTRSLGIGFIGDFTEKLPNPQQIDVAKKFLKCAVDLGEIDVNYKLLGARQVSSTQSPGLKLYHELKHWRHFAANP